MKTIGLIGGMSFESTAVYYRQINELVRARLGGLASADILLHSVNFADIVALQKAGRWDAAAETLSQSARALQKAGADCILICTNTMHKIADQVAASVDIPLINIIDETALALKAAGANKPLLLATRYTMEDGFYAGRLAQHNATVMTPDADGRTLVHDAIFEELCCGVVSETARAHFITIVERARQDGADSVILGCTEICLLVDADCLSLPVFDSTTIHAAAAVEFALKTTEEQSAAA